jgi:serine acetyltransferase
MMRDPQVTIVMVLGEVYVGHEAHTRPNAVVVTKVPNGATAGTPAPCLVRPTSPTQAQDEPRADVR